MRNRIDYLDGVRAILALWVVLGHIATLVGIKIPLLTKASVAVDLFMVLSGFFVYLTYTSLESKVKNGRHVLFFYCRRFFRVWPLYVVLILAVWLMLDMYSAMKLDLAVKFPPPWANSENYQLKAYPHPTGFQFLTHVTMLFGIWPSWGVASPLPDWSLSLEFQFYLLFPLVIFFYRRNMLTTCIVAFGLAYIAPKVGGLYLDAGLLTRFSQPSNLAYKLNIFLIGCLLAELLSNSAQVKETQQSWKKWLAMLICIIGVDPVAAIFLAALVYLIIFADKQKCEWLAKPYLVFVGKVSYTLYLCHMLAIIPVAFAMSNLDWFADLHGILRFSLVSLIGLPLAIALSALLWELIEKRGIDFAARLTKPAA
jgi:peptidoglycan/LPS O-acetylase OafA/YrhL